MKIRMNFVSNSSSSSCIVYLPDNLKFKDLKPKDYALQELKDNEGSLKDAEKAFDKLKTGEELYEYDDHASFFFLTETLGDYVVASVDGGPDAGQLVPVNKNKLSELMKGE